METIKKHIKKVYYWVIILVVIAALALAYVYTQNKKSGYLTEQQEQAIMDQLAKSSPSILTDQQKLDSLQNLSNNSPVSQYTPEDRLKIIQNLGQ